MECIILYSSGNKITTTTTCPGTLNTLSYLFYNDWYLVPVEVYNQDILHMQILGRYSGMGHLKYCYRGLIIYIKGAYSWHDKLKTKFSGVFNYLYCLCSVEFSTIMGWGYSVGM